MLLFQNSIKPPLQISILNKFHTWNSLDQSEIKLQAEAVKKLMLISLTSLLLRKNSYHVKHDEIDHTHENLHFGGDCIFDRCLFCFYMCWKLCMYV